MAKEYGISMNQASLLPGLLCIFSTVGRLFFGHLADNPRVNRLYVYQLSFLGMGVANTLCPLLRTFPTLIAYCALFGFFEGCYVCQVRAFRDHAKSMSLRKSGFLTLPLPHVTLCHLLVRFPSPHVTHRKVTSSDSKNLL